MTLSPGTRLGRYVIVEPIAGGGMGQVYRARDTQLERSVAIKVIGSGLGHDPELRRRFDTEARLAAQLDHPRVCPVHDVGHERGTDYLVMEFLEGETLAQRLLRGPIAMPDLVGFAIEIASALAYAHARGVIHRDVKPGNIFLTRAGIRVVDFGLARLRQLEHTPSADLAAQKTRRLAATEPGAVLGTPEYVPPERLEGREGDHREDIFAFGALLYEMATARRAFQGGSPAAIITAVMSAEPPPMEGGTAPPAVEWVVRRCLLKDPELRWQSMRDVELVLKGIAGGLAESGTALPGAAPSPARRTRLVAAGAGLGIAVLALVGLRDSAVRPVPDRVAFTVPPPPASGFTPTESSVRSPQLAVAPDGGHLAFVATSADGVSQVWLRASDTGTARPLAGTVDAIYPFWSASSRSLGFFSHGELKRVDIDGSPARLIAPARAGNGGAWSEDDIILFSPEPDTPLYRVSADGTVRQQTVLSPSRRETSHRWPQFLPDGRHFIYFAKSADETQSGIRLASLDAPGETLVVRTKFAATYVPSGHLLYVSERALLAASFDPSSGRLGDDPVTLVDRVATSSNFYGAFSASNTGVLAYATPVPPAELAWIGRDGRRLGVAAGPGEYVDYQLSPDGRYVAVGEVEPQSDRSDIRLIDLVRGGNQRLTTSPATDASPVWSPDGTRLAFRSNRVHQHDLYLRLATVGAADDLFVQSPVAKYPTDWSPDGRFIVYHAFDQRTHYDVWQAPIGHPDQSRPLVQSDMDDVQGQISPTGRWLAYTSNQGSRFEVYVQPLHGEGRKWQVSIDGGCDPKWRGDEKQLFFMGPDGRIMSVAWTGVEPGVPRPLFPLRDIAVIPPYLSAYDVQADGQRFLVRLSPEQLQTHALNVVVNWSVPVRGSRLTATARGIQRIREVGGLARSAARRLEALLRN